LKSYDGIIINENDDGISDAFNKGILASSGDYLMVLNSGDILLHREYLIKAEEILEQNKDISFVHSNILFEEKYAGNLVMHPKMKNIGRGMPYFHQSMVIRRSVFDSVGLYNKDYKISMDYDLIVRMEKKGLKGFYLDGGPVVKMDGNGVSNTREFKTMTEAVRSLWENKHLNIYIAYNLLVRIFLFSLRKMAVVLGVKVVYVKLMKWKYSRVFYKILISLHFTDLVGYGIY
ncbi:MAG: hypothetical protein ACM34O_13895, partial [Ignavibacteria bacterium]